MTNCPEKQSLRDKHEQRRICFTYRLSDTAQMVIAVLQVEAMVSQANYGTLVAKLVKRICSESPPKSSFARPRNKYSKSDEDVRTLGGLRHASVLVNCPRWHKPS